MTFVFKLPIVRQHDFEAFMEIMGKDIPNTYNEWLNLGAKWRTDAAYQPFVEVEVHPDEFKKFTADKGSAPTMNELLVFTSSLGKN